MALKSDKSKSIIKEKKAPKSVAAKNEEKKTASKKTVKIAEKPKQTVKSDTKSAKAPEKKATVKKSTSTKPPVKKELKSKPAAAPKKIKSATAKSSSEDLNFDLEKSTSVKEDSTLKKQVDLPFPKWEIYIDNAGEYRFRLYATNGLCVCHSAHGYSTKSGCKGGIESIKRFSQEAIVDKSYLS